MGDVCISVSTAWVELCFAGLCFRLLRGLACYAALAMARYVYDVIDAVFFECSAVIMIKRCCKTYWMQYVMDICELKSSQHCDRALHHDCSASLPGDKTI